MKIIIVLLAPIILFSSCLKKVDGVDDLNTNIFDKEYAGESWFYIKDTKEVTNSFGLPRIRINAVLPGANLPGLKPSYVQINCSIDGQPETLVFAHVNTKGDFPFYYDAVTVSSNNYCLTAGIYLETEETTINSFTECVEH